MYLLKYLYQATKVRRRVFVKVPAPSDESELSCICVRGIDFVTRSWVLCVCSVDRCLSFCPFFLWPFYCMFFFDIRILISPLISLNSSWYVFIIWNCSYIVAYFVFQFIPMFICCCLCVCVCVCLALRNNGETLCICCILYKLYICVLLIIVCQSWFRSTGYCCMFPGLLCASAGGG